MSATTTISEQRLGIARYHANDDITGSLLRQAEEGTLEWQHVAHMLACNLQQVDYTLRGTTVYDYERQEWLDAVTTPAMEK